MEVVLVPLSAAPSHFDVPGEFCFDELFHITVAVVVVAGTLRGRRGGVVGRLCASSVKSHSELLSLLAFSVMCENGKFSQTCIEVL